MKGKDAETAAVLFLKRQGLKIISRNKSYKFGELDIIAEDKQGFVFVEVKYRSNPSRGTAAETVNRQKQHRLQKAALMWLQEQDPNAQKPCRFDVIAISGQNRSDDDAANKDGSNGKYSKIEWLKNAF